MLHDDILFPMLLRPLSLVCILVPQTVAISIFHILYSLADSHLTNDLEFDIMTLYCGNYWIHYTTDTPFQLYIFKLINKILNVTRLSFLSLIHNSKCILNLYIKRNQHICRLYD